MSYRDKRGGARFAAARVFTGVVVGAVFLGPAWGALGGDLPHAAAAAAFAPFCHQDPARSWTLLGTQLPVCIRCFGFYLGALTACCLGLRFEKKRLAAAAAVAAAGLGIEALLGGTGSEIARFAGALILAVFTTPALWTETAAGALRPAMGGAVR